MSAISTLAVTGASGFVGRAVVRELLERGYKVRALVRDLDKARAVLPTPGEGTGLSLVVGDIHDGGVMNTLVNGAQACVHLVGVIREGPGMTFQSLHVDATASALRACARAGVGRYLHMSALAADDTGRTAYQRTKFEGERLVRRSGLDWTIFRPGLIHGLDGEFVQMAADWVTGHVPPYFFIPYFTRGETDTSVPLGPTRRIAPTIAPIAVGDVARAFAIAVERPASFGEVYNLVGSQTLTWPELLKAFRDGTHGGNERLHPWGVPAEAAATAAKIAKAVGLGGLLPFDEGMAWMGSQDAVASMDKARAHLGIETAGFEESFKLYSAAL